MVTGAPGPTGAADLLRQGADDCIPEASDPDELSARIEAKLRRVPVPVEHLLRDPRTGLYSRPHFLDELDRELKRPEGARHGGVLAVVAVAELAALEERLGPGSAARSPNGSPASPRDWAGPATGSARTTTATC
ncbi:hypothetical protein O1L44_06565 [Streptomyces noursei]|nr:hypothetical protein [Streptomyces noursei]